jgi:choline dehydrogenase
VGIPGWVSFDRDLRGTAHRGRDDRDCLGPDDGGTWSAEHAVLPGHPVGTCKTGVDELALVDPELRMRGLSGLRVADAAVIPVIVSANTMAAVYGIAERAAASSGT